MKESDVTRKLKHYLEKEKPLQTTTYEVKIVKTKSLAFCRVPQHQIDGLLASLDGLWHKIADTKSLSGFTSQKPFDAIWIKASHAYIVPVFYVPRKYTMAVFIPVNDFVILKETWTKKSIQLEQLRKMDFEIVLL